MEVDLAWNFQSADETGVKLEHCIGENCTVVNLPAGTKSYADSELAASTECCYRVSAYKDRLLQLANRLDRAALSYYQP